MAQSARQGSTLETPVPSFGFPRSAVLGPQQDVTSWMYAGSNSGVPQNNDMGTSNPSISDNVSPAISFGAKASSRVWFQQPLFWAVVLGVLSIIMMAHVARIEIK